eukprot:m.233591 g.233591  ORF g.233591 m.233591 type:complete len:544 (-) comp19297_c0_seq2:235-1866(-)
METGAPSASVTLSPELTDTTPRERAQPSATRPKILCLFRRLSQFKDDVAKVRLPTRWEPPMMDTVELGYGGIVVPLTTNMMREPELFRALLGVHELDFIPEVAMATPLTTARDPVDAIEQSSAYYSKAFAAVSKLGATHALVHCGFGWWSEEGVVRLWTHVSRIANENGIVAVALMQRSGYLRSVRAALGLQRVVPAMKFCIAIRNDANDNCIEQRPDWETQFLRQNATHAIISTAADPCASVKDSAFVRAYAGLVRQRWGRLIAGQNADAVRPLNTAAPSRRDPHTDPTELRLIVNEHEPYVIATSGGRKALGSSARDVAAFFREEAQETFRGHYTTGVVQTPGKEASAASRKRKRLREEVKTTAVENVDTEPDDSTAPSIVENLDDYVIGPGRFHVDQERGRLIYGALDDETVEIYTVKIQPLLRTPGRTTPNATASSAGDATVRSEQRQDERKRLKMLQQEVVHINRHLHAGLKAVSKLHPGTILVFPLDRFDTGMVAKHASNVKAVPSPSDAAEKCVKKEVSSEKSSQEVSSQELQPTR